MQGVPGGEERAVREEVAVRLILDLPERRLAAPQVCCPGEEAAGILCEVVLGVRGDQAGGLRERQDQADDRRRGEPAPPERGASESRLSGAPRVRGQRRVSSECWISGNI